MSKRPRHSKYSVAEQKENWKDLKVHLVKKDEKDKMRKTDISRKAIVTYKYDQWAFFDSWEDIIPYLEEDAIPKEHAKFHEVLVDGMLVKPYLDVEWMRSDINAKYVDQFPMIIKEIIMDFFDKGKMTVPYDHILVLQNHRQVGKDRKQSYHFIVNHNVAFESPTYAKKLAQYIQEVLECKKQCEVEQAELRGRPVDQIIRDYDGLINAIDMNVYKTWQNFRLPYQHKHTDPHVFTPSDSDNTLGDYIISHFESEPLILHVPEPEDKRLENSSESFDNSCIESYIKELHPTAYCEGTDDNNFVHYNYTNRLEPCFATKNLHDSLGFFVMKVDEMYKVGCFSERCKDEQGHRIMKILNIPVVAEVDAPVREDTLISRDFDMLRNSLFIADKIGNLIVDFYRNPQRMVYVSEKDSGCGALEYVFTADGIWEKQDNIIKGIVRANLVRLHQYVARVAEKPEIIGEHTTAVKSLFSSNIDPVVQQCKRGLCDGRFIDRLNTTPSILPVKNGIVELNSGLLRKPIAADYVSQPLQIEYDHTLDPLDSLFYKTLLDVFYDPDQEQVDEEQLTYFMHYIGYMISGLGNLKVILFMYGFNGSEGKSLIMNYLSHVMDTFASTIDSKYLVAQKTTSREGATPSLFEIQKSRLVVVNEVSDRMIDSQFMKLITSGGDEILIRKLYQDPVRKSIRGAFVILGNEFAKYNMTDNALCLRLRCLILNRRFLTNPDPNDPYQAQSNVDLDKQLRLPQNKRETLRFLVYCAQLHHQNPQYLQGTTPRLERNMKKWNDTINPARDFVETYMTFAEGARTSISMLKNKLRQLSGMSGWVNYKQITLSLLQSHYTFENGDMIDYMLQ